MTKLIQIDFKNPIPIKLDDQVKLRDVFNVLVEKGAVAKTVDFNKWASRKLTYYIENIDYLIFDKKVENSGRGAPSKEITTTIQVAMEVIANGHKEAGHQMRRFLTECLRLSTQRQQPKDLSDLLIEAGNRLKQEQALRIQAEKDRAKIGDKKVATAMATASVAVRKLKKSEKANEELLSQLGEAKNWKTAIAWQKKYPLLANVTNSDSALGRLFSKISRKWNFEIREIEDARWGTVKVYEQSAALKILEIYG